MKYNYDEMVAHYKNGYKYAIILKTYIINKGWDIDTLGYFKDKEEALNFEKVMVKAFDNNKVIKKEHLIIETWVIKEDEKGRVFATGYVDIQKIVKKYFEIFENNA